jgi:hypothetical protein
MVQDQPEFEARVGYREVDAMGQGKVCDVLEVWVRLGTLDIEDAPTLINLGVGRAIGGEPDDPLRSPVFACYLDSH